MMIREKPEVSVVIPAYNEEKYLPGCLESLRKQEFDMNKVEIIVVDNNSTDGTAKVAGKYGVRLLRESRKGIGFARNAGFKAANAEIIATTDADTILPTNWVKIISEEFKKDKKCVCIFGPSYYHDASRMMKHVSKMLSLVTRSIMDLLGEPVLPGYNYACIKSAFLKTGGFNIDLNVCVDLDMGLKLKRTGRVKFVKNMWAFPSARRLHRIGVKNFLLNGLKGLKAYLICTSEEAFEDFR